MPHTDCPISDDKDSKAKVEGLLTPEETEYRARKQTLAELAAEGQALEQEFDIK